MLSEIRGENAQIDDTGQVRLGMLPSQFFESVRDLGFYWRVGQNAVESWAKAGCLRLRPAPHR